MLGQKKSGILINLSSQLLTLFKSPTFKYALELQKFAQMNLFDYAF
jgi:hypothetical protein